MGLAFWLTLTGSALFCVAPVIYILHVHRQEITPNPATWFIWALVSSSNASFYYTNAPQNEKFLAILAVLSAVVMMIVFAYTRYKHSFGVMRWVEWASIVLTGTVMLIWATTRGLEGAEGLASAMMQAPMLIGFIPTYIGLTRGNGRERPWPWIFGGSAYVFQIAALTLSPDQDWTRYAWPIVNGLIGNGGVILLIFFSNKRRD
ncbi:TPA: hypothetical protein DDZ10_04680 [Candidatus Uhrbacteria bacterium]|uniref:Uncharacterized protein n=1 Tax=Candidatus Uhrbacteria bacterium GW2011_GWC2_53_7 TaxID=1618986 RepID=A0A0G1XUZ0_9BACT|nr:MAG: hypothetical protein UY82_C0058G0001 [Candidatus Uhrbacteria bacterium GW2011_GWC2_53_7]OGL72421.1 MAG: hypothetical protein A3D69_02410 [Candidatus Uhrbacteria bacterium RIFCSPHIGHO2_02_FULL_54_11]HBL39928.1 hypothetical protein [Candidatus Uhrbacteria bacterium]